MVTNSFLVLAKNTAIIAGKKVLSMYGKAQVYKKGKKDIVTAADKASEKIIISEIKKKFPEHNIISEESKHKKKKSDYTWVIDPIDGTNNFSHKLPFFCISIGLMKKNEPLIGVIYDPLRKELFYAEKNKGAYLNNKRIKVNKTNKLINSIIDVNFGHLNIDSSSAKYKRLSKKVRAFRTLGSVALGFCYVSSGRIDAETNSFAKLWDVLAGTVILTEAGGEVTNQKGKPWKNKEPILATNKYLKNKIVKVL